MKKMQTFMNGCFDRDVEVKRKFIFVLIGKINRHVNVESRLASLAWLFKGRKLSHKLIDLPQTS